MKNETLYNKTVDILVQAYFNDTLEHGQCTMCAVGNLISANLEYPIDRTDGCSYANNVSAHWYDLTFRLHTSYDKQEAKKQINSTGYSITEIIKIENAFERSVLDKGDIMFNGLMAVIEVLDEIHENSDVNLTQLTKNKFIKNADKKLETAV